MRFRESRRERRRVLASFSYVRRRIDPQRHRCFLLRISPRRHSPSVLSWILKSTATVPCRNDARNLRVAARVIRSSAPEAVCWPICDSRIRWRSCWRYYWRWREPTAVGETARPLVLPVGAKLPSAGFPRSPDPPDSSVRAFYAKEKRETSLNILELVKTQTEVNFQVWVFNLMVDFLFLS